jgi:hypothetical protein
MMDITLACELLIQSLQRGLRVPVRLTGILSPLVRPGDSVLLEQVDPERLGMGELVVFEGSSGLIAHRILQKRRFGECAWFQTAGQRAHIPDPWIPGTWIIGRASEIRQGTPGDRGRNAPGRWAGRLWAKRTQIRCLLHRARALLNRFTWR